METLRRLSGNEMRELDAIIGDDDVLNSNPNNRGIDFVVQPLPLLPEHAEIPAENEHQLPREIREYHTNILPAVIQEDELELELEQPIPAGNVETANIPVVIVPKTDPIPAGPEAIPAVPLQPIEISPRAVTEFPAGPAITVVPISAGNASSVQTMEDWQKSRENIGGLPFMAETEAATQDLAGKLGEDEDEGEAVLAGTKNLAGNEEVRVSHATSIMRKSEAKSATQLDSLGVPRFQGNAQLVDPSESVLEDLEQDYIDEYEYDNEESEEEVGRSEGKEVRSRERMLAVRVQDVEGEVIDGVFACWSVYEGDKGEWNVLWDLFVTGNHMRSIDQVIVKSNTRKMDLRIGKEK